MKPTGPCVSRQTSTHLLGDGDAEPASLPTAHLLEELPRDTLLWSLSLVDNTAGETKRAVKPHLQLRDHRARGGVS